MHRGGSAQSESLSRLELALGYAFQRRELLAQALTQVQNLSEEDAGRLLHDLSLPSA